MRIILREDVVNLGKSGDVVTVKDGYGRNYLLPLGLASLATEGNVRYMEHQKKTIAARAVRLQKEAQDLADQLSLLAVKLKSPSGVEGRLFGSIGAKEISSALKTQGVELDRKKIHLMEPIKAVGHYKVEVKLGHGVVAVLSVEVAPLAV